MAGVLSHPNNVTVFDVGEIQGRPYIAMELLDGTPLNDVLASGSRLPVREVVELAIQLASALDYAHARGIFHRDMLVATTRWWKHHYTAVRTAGLQAYAKWMNPRARVPVS